MKILKTYNQLFENNEDLVTKFKLYENSTAEYKIIVDDGGFKTGEILFITLIKSNDLDEYVKTLEEYPHEIQQNTPMLGFKKFSRNDNFYLNFSSDKNENEHSIEIFKKLKIMTLLEFYKNYEEITFAICFNDEMWKWFQNQDFKNEFLKIPEIMKMNKRKEFNL